MERRTGHYLADPAKGTEKGAMEHHRIQRSHADYAQAHRQWDSQDRQKQEQAERNDIIYKTDAASCDGVQFFYLMMDRVNRPQQWHRMAQPVAPIINETESE